MLDLSTGALQLHKGLVCVCWCLSVCPDKISFYTFAYTSPVYTVDSGC